MVDVTPEMIADFRERYPAFEDVATWGDATVESALIEADAETGGAGWGGYAEDPRNFKQRGMFAFAAHYLAALFPSGDSTMSGAASYGVASKSVGDESVSYNSPDMSRVRPGDEWFMSTSFGQAYLRLRRRAGMGARAV